MSTLVFYVGYLFKRDSAVGLEVGRLLEAERVPAVELSGDALYMVDEMRRLSPTKAILVGAVQRGRPPGTIEIYKFKPYVYNNQLEAQDALRPSLEGRISLEDLLIGLSIFGTPTDEIYVAECEPPVLEDGVGLSPEGRKCAEELAKRVKELYRELCTK
ncbi:MAG: Ni,Fe-hydrogenase maturation factor [Thermoproteus sp.]